MRKLVLAFSALCAVAILARPAAAFDQTFDQSYPLAAGGSFELRNVNGSITVTAWERNEVEVHAIKVAHGNPRDVDRVRIEVNAQPNRVSVDTHYPQDDGVEVSVEYRIHVPSRAVLGHVSTVNGSVRVSGLECAGELHTVNGDVEALDGTGHFSARTTNGNIRLELRQLSGTAPLTAESINGNIVLALGDGTGAQLDVSTRNGDFRSDLPVTLKGSLGAREFHGQLGTGGADIRIHTVNGNIRIVSYRPTV